MKIIIDYRENDLYEKILKIEYGSSIEIIKENLHLGDIVFRYNEIDILIIERKTINDLCASIKDGRYKEQSYRLLNSVSIKSHNIVYIIEGMMTNISSETKKIVYGAITSLAFLKEFSVLRTWSVGETAELLINMARKIEKEWIIFSLNLENTKNSISSVEENSMIDNNIKNTDYVNVVKKIKKENINKENIGEIMLCQIPGLSSQTAIQIINHYKSLCGLIDSLRNNRDCLKDFKIDCNNGKKRNLSKKIIENLYNFLIIEKIEDLQKELIDEHHSSI